MKRRPHNPYGIMPQRCLLCANELTPHEATGGHWIFCARCSSEATQVGRGKAHLCIKSPEPEWVGGVFMASDFVESLTDATYVAAYDEDHKLLKLFDAGSREQMEEYYAWAAAAGWHDTVSEPAFQWPVGMVVELWKGYVYSGTFEVYMNSSNGRDLREIPGSTPQGSQAYTHTEFSEQIPEMRYRRLLDPNWQCSLSERSRKWRRTQDQHYAIGVPQRGLPISPEVYAFWGAHS